MPSDFNAFTDVSVSTLLMLCKGAADADLLATIGGPAVERVIGHPVLNVPAGGYPVLMIHRASEIGMEQGQTRWNPLTTFEIRYIAPVTTDTNISARWPLLHRVWWSMIAAMQQGYHPSVSSGAKVMSQSGLTMILGEGARVVYQRLPGDTGGVYPSFVASVQMSEAVDDTIGTVDVDDLDAFLALHTTLAPSDATATTPDLEQTVTLPGYGA